MSFSFFHISDLHFGAEEASKRVFRDEVKKKIRDNKLSADCLIISGDLFNRGKLDRDGISSCRDFLSGMPGSMHTIVVPGNHDLDRSAQEKKDNGGYNDFLTRKEIVRNRGDEALQGRVLLSNDEKQVLRIDAYRDFFAFSDNMEFIGFKQTKPENEELVFVENEVQEIIPSFQIASFPFPIRFVLLNTGLIAGQSVRGKDYLDKKRELEAKYEKAKNEGDFVQAAKKQVEIAKQEKTFVYDGELIIDEEDCEEDGDGPGRLSLSNEANLALSRIKEDNTALTIFIGHHGYKFLSSETKKALKQAMKSRKSGIYLCGHAHQAGYNLIKIGNNTVPTHISQIQAGAMFKDGEDNAVQCGFNHGTFYVDDNNIIQGKIISYFLIKSASGEQRWMQEEIPIQLSGISLPEGGETIGEKPEKPPVNVIDPDEGRPISGPVPTNRSRANTLNKWNEQRKENYK